MAHSLFSDIYIWQNLANRNLMNYDQRKFKPVSNSENGEVTNEMIFIYRQRDNILSCQYSGANIRFGQLLGLVKPNGNIEMRYHQINKEGKIMTGKCISNPELMSNGKIRLHETWQWTSGDLSKGQSILEELWYNADFFKSNVARNCSSNNPPHWLLQCLCLKRYWASQITITFHLERAYQLTFNKWVARQNPFNEGLHFISFFLLGFLVPENKNKPRLK